MITWAGLVRFAGMCSGQAWRNGLGLIQNVWSEKEEKVFSNDDTLGGAFFSQKFPLKFIIWRFKEAYQFCYL